MVSQNNISASTSDGPATTDAAIAALAAEAGLIDPVPEPSGGLSFMVAADDGVGDGGQMEDSCNGNEATTAAALVSQMDAGEPMQVDGDGNFVLPQVDGPIDALLSEDEEKMDLNEEPAPSESTTESTNIDESAEVTEQDVNIQPENIQTEKSTVNEEAATTEAATTDLPESIIPSTTSEVPEEVPDNPPVDDVPIETSADDAEQPSEKEADIKPLIDEAKMTKPDSPLIQSPVEAPSEQTTLEDIANPTVTKTDETQQEESSQAKDKELESHSAEDEKPSAAENLSIEDTSHLPKDETQETEKKVKEEVEPEVDLPAENSLVKSEDANESMITDDITLTTAVNITPTTTPVITPSIQLKLEPTMDEPMEQDKSPDLPISSINGVALPLEKEPESVAKVHTPVKVEVKDELASSKRENLKQDKLNGSRSETGDDSTALTTLATAALGSAESPIKVKSEQVDPISMYCIFATNMHTNAIVN